MGSSTREQIVEAFDVLHTAVSRVLELSFDVLTTPERLGFLERLERVGEPAAGGWAWVDQSARRAGRRGPDGDFSDEDRARRRALVVGKQDADGMSRISGYLTPEARAAVEAVLAKLAAPGMCNPTDETPVIDGAPPEQAVRQPPTSTTSPSPAAGITHRPDKAGPPEKTPWTTPNGHTRAPRSRPTENQQLPPPRKTTARRR